MDRRLSSIPPPQADGSLVFRLLGRYRLEQLVGQGVASVYRAFDLQRSETVAVKLVSAKVARRRRTAVERLLREAALGKSLVSPHTATMHEYGPLGSGGYLVMEFLEGETVARRVKRWGTMPASHAAEVITQLGLFLDTVHRCGVVHRDIKPSNLFLTAGERGDIVKLLDFGIAKSTNSAHCPLTRVGAVLGSPPYMSPEQYAAPSLVDPRADLWSLSAVAYFLLTGKRAFGADTVAAVAKRVRAFQYQPASELLPGLPPAVDRFFRQAFNADMSNRFHTGRELVACFREATRRRHPQRVFRLASAGAPG